MIFAASLVLVSCACAAAQPPTAHEQNLKQLAKLESEFLKDQQAAKQTAAKRFDALLAEITKNPNIAGSERASLIRRWTDEKERFLKYDELRPDADLAELAIQYGFQVSDQYRPLGKKYDLLIGEALRRGENKPADEMLTAKGRFEREHLNGRQEFTAKTVWEGTRQNRNNTIPFRLAVDNRTGDVFQGQIDINGPVTGHPIFEIRGTIDGARLQISTARQRQGAPEQLDLEGVVIGRSMFLRMQGLRARRGRGARPTGGFVVLSKR
jgi:hypothetical protein